jgi:soluble lytic murein transglycosylase
MNSLRMMRDLNSQTRPPIPRRWMIALAGVLGASLVAFLVYSGTAWAWFRPVVHKHIINKYAGQYKFDPLWVMAITKVESGFWPRALSHRGAVGLMQILPSTARDIAPEIGLQIQGDADLHNPDINLHLGVYYLSKLQQIFPDDEIAVLAAYNAGPGVTREWRRGKPVLEIADIAYPETRRFVRNVDRTYGFLKMVQGWKHLLGFAHGR